jgi:hypothetical protein
MTTTTVTIPGALYATYTDGEITGWTFTPHASGAGYFGPAATVWDYDDSDDDDGAGLDVESVDGPFWQAVQRTLAESNPFTVEWQE